MSCAWMRGEERKNESRKGERGESRVGGGLDPVDTATTTNIITASTTTSTIRDRARNLVPTRVHTPIYSGIFSFLFQENLTLRASLSRSLPLSPYSSPDIFSPLALSTIRYFERERPPLGRFPHDDFGTYLLLCFLKMSSDKSGRSFNFISHSIVTLGRVITSGRCCAIV